MPVTLLSDRDVLTGIRSMKGSAYRYERAFVYFLEFIGAFIDLLIGFIAKVRRDGVEKLVVEMLDLGLFTVGEYGNIIPFWLSAFITDVSYDNSRHNWKLLNIKKLVYRIARDEGVYRDLFGLERPRVFEKVRERVFGDIRTVGKRELFEKTLKRLDEVLHLSLMDSVLEKIRFMGEFLEREHYSSLLIDNGAEVFEELKNNVRVSVFRYFDTIVSDFFKKAWSVLALYVYTLRRYPEVFDGMGEEVASRVVDRLGRDYLIAWAVHEPNFGFEDDMGNSFFTEYKSFVFKLFEGNTVLSDGTRLRNYDKIKSMVIRSARDNTLKKIMITMYKGFLNVFDRKEFIGTSFYLEKDFYLNPSIIFVYFLYAFLFGVGKDSRFMGYVHLFYDLAEYFVYLVFVCESLLNEKLVGKPPIEWGRYF